MMARLLNITLAIIFIISSMLKAVNIHSFAMEAGEYIDLYMPQFLHGCQMPCAIGVCSIEMCTGLWAFRKEYVRVTNFIFLLLLSFFVYLTGLNFFFPTILGRVESCGCFGELIHFSPLASFGKSAALWGIALYAVTKNGIPSTVPMRKVFRDEYVYASVAVGLIPSLYSLMFFNEMEHVSYLLIYATLCCGFLIMIWKAYYNKQHESNKVDNITLTTQAKRSGSRKA